jgi:hypothetical protein
MLAGAWVVTRAIALPPHHAEAALALAVVFLALEGVRRRSGDWQLIILTAIAGFMHGVGMAASVLSVQDPKLDQMAHWAGIVLGMDATQLVLALLVTVLHQRLLPSSMASRVRMIGAYGIGSAAIAFLLVLSVVSPRPDRIATSATDRFSAILPVASRDVSNPIAHPPSQRLASVISDASLQNFLTRG